MTRYECDQCRKPISKGWAITPISTADDAVHLCSVPCFVARYGTPSHTAPDTVDHKGPQLISRKTVTQHSGARLDQRIVNIGQLLKDFMGGDPPNDWIIVTVEQSLRGADEEQLRDFLLTFDAKKQRAIVQKGYGYLGSVIENEFGSLIRKALT
jgi:hypothetical protein